MTDHFKLEPGWEHDELGGDPVVRYEADRGGRYILFYVTYEAYDARDQWWTTLNAPR